MHEGAQREPECVQERVLVLVPDIQDECDDKMMIGTMMISYHDHDNDHGSDDNDEKRVLVLVSKYPLRKEGGCNDDG